MATRRQRRRAADRSRRTAETQAKLNQWRESFAYDFFGFEGFFPRDAWPMSRDKELGVWGFEHMVLYLRAMILRATPQPHRTVVRVLALVDPIVATMTPRDLHREATQPPDTKGAGRFSREASNMICEVVSNWAGFVKGPGDIWRGGQERGPCYMHARTNTRTMEHVALKVCLTYDDLYECAVDAFTPYGVEITRDKRDAAIAAMTAGSFSTACEILTQPD